MFKTGDELTAEFAAREVEWYGRNGRFVNRVTLDSKNREYVIGDAGWNRGARPREYIEWIMSKEATPNGQS